MLSSFVPKELVESLTFLTKEKNQVLLSLRAFRSSSKKCLLYHCIIEDILKVVLLNRLNVLTLYFLYFVVNTNLLIKIRQHLWNCQISLQSLTRLITKLKYFNMQTLISLFMEKKLLHIWIYGDITLKVCLWKCWNKTVPDLI